MFKFQGQKWIADYAEQPYVLVHESSHALHKYLDEQTNFSETWRDTCRHYFHPDNTLEENGMLDPYARGRKSSDEERRENLGILAKIIVTEQERTFYDGQLEVRVWNCNPDVPGRDPSKSNAQEIADKVIRQVRNLPGVLSKVCFDIRVIGYEDNLTWDGLFVPWGATSELYDEIAEDVATHTHEFYRLLNVLRGPIAEITPEDVWRTRRGLRDTRVRDRLNLLTYYGFLDTDHGSQLLDALQDLEARYDAIHNKTLNGRHVPHKAFIHLEDALKR